MLDRLWSRASAIAELADGLEIRFDAEGPDVTEIAEFLEKERACCRFLRFSLELEPDGGPIRLRVTGPPGTKGFLASELGLERDPGGDAPSRA